MASDSQTSQPTATSTLIQKNNLNLISQPKTATSPTSNTSSTGSSNGKRKRNKHRNRKSQSSRTVTQQRPAVREYVSKCCNAPAKKPRTGTPLGEKRENSGGKTKTDPTAVRGLGGWRCSGCSKPTKVTAQNIKGAAPVAEEGK